MVLAEARPTARHFGGAEKITTSPTLMKKVMLDLSMELFGLVTLFQIIV